MQRKILITGAIRSGKSRFALNSALSYSPPRIFLATAEALDEEMKTRILCHQKERGTDFVTVEAPVNLIEALQSPESKKSSIILVDCITLWLNNLFHYFPTSSPSPLPFLGEEDQC